MKSNFVRLFITTYMLTVASADLSRPRRDLVQIQDFVRWLLGINERTLVQTIPLIENYEKIYTIPSYENLIVRTAPQAEINEENFERTVFTEERYPGEIIRPVHSIVNSDNLVDYPIVYNNNPPHIMQRYSDDRHMFPYINNNYFTETNQPLTQPPQYIQNRMREIISNRPVLPVNLHRNDIVKLRPNLREVEVADFAVRHTSPTEDKKVETNTTPILSNNTKKKVAFTNPVRSKYTYKMINHNEPHKNIVVKMDTIHPQTANIPKQKDTLNKNREAADYLYVPPLTTEMPPPGMPKVNKNSMKSLTLDGTLGGEHTSIEKDPVVVLDESRYKKAVHGDMFTKSRFVNAGKRKSLTENGRGDIPELSERSL